MVRGSKAAKKEPEAVDEGLNEHPLLKRVILPNGFKIVLLPNAYPKERFLAYLEVKTGSLNEEDDQQGLAHFLEHVVFLGTEKWKTADEMRDLMGKLGMSFGGDTNASTDQRFTIYSLEAPSLPENAALVVDILHQMMFKALLEDKCIDSERGPVLSELQMRNTISFRTSCILMQLLHPHNMLPKRFPIGLQEQIARFNSHDMRRFYKKWYHPSNMTLFLVGEFNEAQVIAAAATTFGAEPAPAQIPPPPTLLHTYQRPAGAGAIDAARARVFLHDLHTVFSFTVTCVQPLPRFRTAADFTRETMDHLVLACFDDRLEALRSSQPSPPFSEVELDASSDR